MKVLLTGASGFLGRYVLRELQAAGMSVVTAGRRPSGAATPHIVADLLDPSEITAAVRQAGATHLLHMAWYAEHGKFWTSPLNLRWVDATTRLVEAFCEQGGRYVAVAGSGTEYDWSCGYMREDATALAPATLYGISKDAARRLVQAVCAQHQVPCAWGRVFFPYGPGEAAGRLLPSLMSVFQGQRAPFGVNALAYRDFLHAGDIASGFMALLHAQAEGVFNVCSGQAVQVAQLVRELAGFYDYDPDALLALATERPGEPAMVVGENAKLKALGWRPRLSLAQGLEQYVRGAGQP